MIRFSRLHIPTIREVPAEAELASHKLMIRAGMIRQTASGIYSYLPIGYRVIRKIEQIIREEMERFEAAELLMPAMTPAELWRESGRWELYGPELVRFRDRHDRDFCLGPTHEEVVCDLVRRDVRSYRQLPLNLFQIQTKVRDEIRPRFGVMRAREFIMKDGYSFDQDDDSAKVTYEKMKEAYNRIFERCGLTFRMVEADSGNIGGSFSHEFMVLADSGEDEIAFCNACSYAANTERAECLFWPDKENEEAPAELAKVDTPGVGAVEEVSQFLSLPPARFAKTLIFEADGKPVAAVVRGDRELNEFKLKARLGCDLLEIASPELVEQVTGAKAGFAGPVGLKDVTIVADLEIEGAMNLVTGANQTDVHYKNVNPGRDFQPEAYWDLRKVVEGDNCPRCSNGKMALRRGIEVGHIFKLGTKYSRKMDCLYKDREGKSQPMVMGCYGIGVGRTMAAAIEQNHDKSGIIWPYALAPFQILLIPLDPREEEVAGVTESLERELAGQGYEVLVDDRTERPGVKFKDADLIGIPFRVTIGVRDLKEGVLEIKSRTGQKLKFPKSEASSRVIGFLDSIGISTKSPPGGRFVHSHVNYL